jgi:hypothetical protein
MLVGWMHKMHERDISNLYTVVSNHLVTENLQLQVGEICNIKVLQLWCSESLIWMKLCVMLNHTLILMNKRFITSLLYQFHEGMPNMVIIISKSYRIMIKDLNMFIYLWGFFLFFFYHVETFNNNHELWLKRNLTYVFFWQFVFILSSLCGKIGIYWKWYE